MIVEGDVGRRHFRSRPTQLPMEVGPTGGCGRTGSSIGGARVSRGGAIVGVGAPLTHMMAERIHRHVGSPANQVAGNRHLQRTAGPPPSAPKEVAGDGAASSLRRYLLAILTALRQRS